MRTSWSIEPPSCFDLERTVLSHGFYQVPPFSWEPGALHVAVRRPLARVTVSQPTRGSLRIDVISGRAASRPRMERTVAHVLDFGRDVAAFHRLCRTYPPLGWAARARAGRILRCPDLASDVVVSICGTNTTWSQAVRSVHRLAEIAPLAPGGLRAFPTPAEILEAGASHLVDRARVGYRHRSIQQFCRRVLSGEIETAVDPSMDGPALRAFFRSIPGIGPVTARYLACLHGRTDEIAIDSFVLRYIGDKYHGGRRPSVRAVERRYARFGEHRALAYWFECLGDVSPVTWRRG